jgi:hypothetical protein
VRLRELSSMTQKLTRTYTTEAYVEELTYNTQHGTLTLTITVIPHENEPPRIYVSNEELQLHQRLRCTHTSRVDNFAQVYYYGSVCVAMHGEWEYMLELKLVDIKSIRTPIVDELMGKDPSAEPERRWTLVPKLLQCTQVPLANETRDIPEEVFPQ